MPTVTNRLVDASGQPLVRYPISIFLVGQWSADGSNESVPLSAWSGVTDASGVWAVVLPAQSEYEDLTYYKINEPGGVSHTFTVADTPDVQRLRDRLMEPVQASAIVGITLDSLVDVSTSGALPGQALVLHEGGLWSPGTVMNGPGGGVSDHVSQYRHDQLSAGTVWEIPHALGNYPAAISVYSPDLSQEYNQYAAQHLDINNVRISMDLPTAGVALLSTGVPDSLGIDYRHDQTISSETWVIVHNLNRYPASVMLYSSDLSQRYDGYMVRHIDQNHLQVEMDTLTFGVAFLI